MHRPETSKNITFADDTVLYMMVNLLTWRDSGVDGSALHVVLHGDNTDVVLHPWDQVVQGAGVLAGLHKLLHAVARLAIGGSARHLVAGDILEGKSLQVFKMNVFFFIFHTQLGTQERVCTWCTGPVPLDDQLSSSRVGLEVEISRRGQS